MRPDPEMIPVLIDTAKTLKASQRRLFMAKTVAAMGRGVKCAPEFGHKNGGAYGTCTHALAKCFSRHWLSNSAGVRYPSDEWIRLRL